LHHNEHEHFELAGFAGKEVLLELPVEGHALNATLYYEITLAMRTVDGQTLYSRYILRPQVTTIQTLSWPGPATVTIDQLAQAPGQIVQVTVGDEHILEAPERIVHEGKVGVFRNWVVTPSWPQVSGGEANSEIEAVIVTERVYNLVVPVEASTYIAFYEYVQPAAQTFLPSILQ
jgi:hypothetical protein